MREVYQNEEDANVVDDALETMVGKEARRMLAAALEEEVSAFLGRDRYERDDEFRGYRNGDHPSREFTIGVTVVEVKAPRVRDVPAEVSTDGFESKIVKERPPLSGVVLLSKSPVCFRMRVAVSEGSFPALPKCGISTILTHLEMTKKRGLNRHLLSVFSLRLRHPTLPPVQVFTLTGATRRTDGPRAMRSFSRAIRDGHREREG